MESMKDGLTKFNMESMKEGLTKGVAQVQTAVDNMDLKIPNNAYLEKLTLTTPELRAERQRIDEEERRKETVRNMLANMLPWETRDAERDILVEECKEAILKLSTDKETFFGPYQMPKAVGLGKMKRLEGVSEKEEDNEDEKEEHEEEEEESTADSHKPSKESLEKLAKLEPLPPLLQDFNLDAHVGLIQNLVEVDPRLSSMQSKLSGTLDYVGSILEYSERILFAFLNRRLWIVACVELNFETQHTYTTSYMITIIHLQAAANGKRSFGATTFSTAPLRDTRPV
jgi:hypothetical protein